MAVALLAEGVLWPAERRVQAGLGPVGSAPPDASATGRDATVMVRMGSAIVVLLLVATALMIAQP